MARADAGEVMRQEGTKEVGRSQTMRPPDESAILERSYYDRVLRFCSLISGMIVREEYDVLDSTGQSHTKVMYHVDVWAPLREIRESGELIVLARGAATTAVLICWFCGLWQWAFYSLIVMWTTYSKLGVKRKPKDKPE
eukprot:CAMPEP_0181301446 /NCGR_PEP_ID=MMETSP1101-20121128/7429_1 /TAXON_ID=46948 /ORGANISM="Rhodomonas abbreviata, Strain Caron Lab Isolate" /LENGTH=138 /DNA_ID=CAMNT_0023406753 /DNA_START=30 /DNA_END=446 /DNA_ORIENTATION=-